MPSIAYSKHKAKRQRKRESDVQIRLEELEKRISDSTNADFIKKALNEKEILKQQLLLFYEENVNGLMLRSKTRWTEKGEKPTIYFFYLEKRNYSRKKITELELPNGKHLHKADKIMKEIENFYKDLYTSNGEIEDDRFANFVQNLDIPKLQDFEKEELEGEITLVECKEVLKTFSSGKSTGEDGFTWVLKLFLQPTGEDQINYYNAAYKEGEMSIS